MRRIEPFQSSARLHELTKSLMPSLIAVWPLHGKCSSVGAVRLAIICEDAEIKRNFLIFFSPCGFLDVELTVARWKASLQKSKWSIFSRKAPKFVAEREFSS